MDVKDHEFIYLQSKENSESEGRLWCQDSVYEDDTKYMRFDLVEAQEAEIKRLRDALTEIAEIERPVDMCTWDKGTLIRLIKTMESMAETALGRGE